MNIGNNRNMKTECYQCTHRKEIPGDAHSRCVKPDAAMVGNPHGIKKGWFMYPINFDPVWKERLCQNFEPMIAINPAISQPISRAE